MRISEMIKINYINLRLNDDMATTVFVCFVSCPFIRIPVGSSLAAVTIHMDKSQYVEDAGIINHLILPKTLRGEVKIKYGDHVLGCNAFPWCKPLALGLC